MFTLDYALFSDLGAEAPSHDVGSVFTSVSNTQIKEKLQRWKMLVNSLLITNKNVYLGKLKLKLFTGRSEVETNMCQNAEHILCYHRYQASQKLLHYGQKSITSEIVKISVLRKSSGLHSVRMLNDQFNIHDGLYRSLTRGFRSVRIQSYISYSTISITAILCQINTKFKILNFYC